MNNEMIKSLNSLIDETLTELEELKKSRFSAAEIDLAGPGSDGIAGKPANGSLGKEEDKKDEDKKKEDEEEAKKSDGINDCAKAEDEESEEEKKRKKEEMEKADKEKAEKEEKEKEDKEEIKMLKKSIQDNASLMKSLVDERMKPLEAKLGTIMDLVSKIADQPVAARGFTARGAVPLLKSNEESYEPLSKAQVANKLFELKKSGTPVDSADIARAEMGQDLESISKKYKIS